MSGICGFQNRDGAPHDASILSAMLDSVSCRGPDGITCWAKGAIALGHLQLATTPESLAETQPLRDEGADLVIVFDGRIDNRPELRAELSGADRIPGTSSDAALVLSAYQRWGEDCCTHLIGDFAFVIRDGGRNALFAARDAAGVKPFCYFVDQGCFVFGSELAQVLRHPAVPRRVNEGMVGEYLACSIVSRRDTLFLDVQRLPPGHCLLVDSKRLSVRSYWSITPGTGIRYRRHEDYVEHFLELLRRAVADRLRCVGGAGVSLSGGLDSSAVAGVAQGILAQQAGERSLNAFSVTFPGTDADERAYIDCVVSKWGLSAHCLPYAGIGTPDWSGQVRQTQDLPDYPTTTMNAPLRAAAASRQVRVLLSGVGGNSWLSGSSYPYQDLLGRFAVGPILDEIRYRAAEKGWRHAMSRLFRGLLWPLLPSATRALVERTRSAYVRSPFLTDQFVQRINLDDRLHDNVSGDRFSNLALWETCRHATGGIAIHVLEAEDRADASFGIEQRHPFHDRRLVEYLTSLPDDVKRRTSDDRLLLRRSGVLPRRVAERRDTGDFSVCFEQALATETVFQSLSRLRIAENGWVRGDSVNAALQQLRAGPNGSVDGKGVSLISLWMIFALESWYGGAIINPENITKSSG